jgi:hypothetical protein
MKSDELPPIENGDEKILLWSARVEVGQVQYSQNPNLGIDFYNEIDSWTRMEHAFRQRILRPRHTERQSDLRTFYYSFKGNTE